MSDQNIDRRLQTVSIADATALLESMNTRLAVAGPNWRVKQLIEWQQLRSICNQCIARIELSTTKQVSE